MRRIHLFELEDQRWLPKSIRDAGTDFLRFVAEAGNAYGPIVSKLKQALVKTESKQVLDLCSGGGGPVVGVYQRLIEAGCEVEFTLTDKFPNLAAFEYARKRSGGDVDFIEDPVDATSVPPHLSGLRTLFASLHHFRPEMARRILQDAVDQRRPIGVFEMGERSFRPPPLAMLTTPLAVLLLMPFVRPFRWSRLFWTYVIPIVPLFVMWDGAVSALRMYSTQELQKMVDGLRSDDYLWEIGRETTFLAPITYLLGYPKQRIES